MIFGIDFGTTNTRVAYYDGARVRLVRFAAGDGNRLHQVPTRVAYQSGRPFAFGYDARKALQADQPGRPIKWLLDSDEPVEIGGHTHDAVQIAAEFFTWLKQAVRESGIAEPLRSAAVTVPVKYSLRAKQRLRLALERAGIQVVQFFPEPVAALYCDMVGSKSFSGVAAVFDWGGGTLDVATLTVKDGFALINKMDGDKRGGDDFDNYLSGRAMAAFLKQNPAIMLSADDILKNTSMKNALNEQAEWAKHRLSEMGGETTRITARKFIGGTDLDYVVKRSEFESLIEQDVAHGLNCLDRALKDIPRGQVMRLFLSGGTCHIPLVQSRLRDEGWGSVMRSTLELPEKMRGRVNDPGGSGLDDVANATAIGAALLAGQGGCPVLSRDIGIRLSNDGALDRFYCVFKRGESVTAGIRAREKFCVTETQSGVARLMLCDRADQEREPQGRLLRILPLPIVNQERFIEAHFEFDAQLALHVSGKGQMSGNADGAYPPVDNLSFGYQLPRD